MSSISNTRVEYMYRDASNYKSSAVVILVGSLSDSQISEIQKHLDSEEYFIPSMVGLDDLQLRLAGAWADDDHPYHTLVKISETSNVPDGMVTAQEFFDKFISTNWDDHSIETIKAGLTREVTRMAVKFKHPSDDSRSHTVRSIVKIDIHSRYHVYSTDVYNISKNKCGNIRTQTNMTLEEYMRWQTNMIFNLVYQNSNKETRSWLLGDI